MRPTRTFNRLNDAQRHALDTRRNLAVRANAGSGKTRVLVERIVQLLAQSWDEDRPLNVTSLAAVTFTRKAAAEFRQRLAASFTEMAAASAVERERLYWTAQIDDLARATIGTIDSFCARILREFGFPDHSADRIEPDFETLDPYDEAVLKREAIDRVVNRLSTVAAESSGEATALAEACRWWAVTQGYDALTQHLTALLDQTVDAEIIVGAYRDGKSPAKRVEEAWSDLPAVQRLHSGRAELQSSLRKIVSTCESVRKPGQLLHQLQEGLHRVLEALDRPGPQGEEQALGALRAALLTREGERRSMRGLTAVQDDVQALQATWQGLLRSFDLDIAGELCVAEAVDKLVRLFAPVAHEYLDMCRQSNRFDFLTIARRTRDLLRDNVSVRRRVQGANRYVLVDEFQDTNPLQWEIISYIVGEGPQGPLDGDRLFIVGDPQQSIYRFRRADVGVFVRVEALIRAENERRSRAALPTDYDRMMSETAEKGLTADQDQRLGLMPLAENYRSLAPMPLLLMDRVFHHVFDPALHPPDVARNSFEIEYQHLKPGIDKDASGEVYYVIAGAGDPADVDEESAGPDQAEEMGAGHDLTSTQVAAVVDRLVALHGQTKHTADPAEPQELAWRDMAVLLPSRTLILTPLEREFRRRRVPFIVTGGIGFWQRQEVRDVIHLATCLADPGDELALFVVLRSPIGQLTDTETLFLSEFGRGSLRRGLAMLAHVGGSLSTTAADDGEDGRQHSSHWQSLPKPVQQTLSEVWEAFPDEAQRRLRRIAVALLDWRERVDRMAHADLLQRSLEETGAYALYASEVEGDVILANLDQLFDIIRAEEEGEAPGLARLSRRLRARMEDAPTEEQASLSADRDAVQVMTVHAAKGLEFPVVAVLKMDRKVDRASTSRLMVKTEWDALLADDAERILHCRAGTIAVSVRHPDRPRETYTPQLLKALRDLDRAQQLAESRRLFYVAATRAKERLILAGKPPGQTSSGKPAKLQSSWQKWFEEALGLTEEHKGNGAWEDTAAGLRVIIHTMAAAVDSPAETTPFMPKEGLDLEAIHEDSNFFSVATTALEQMRQAWRENRKEWRLRYRLHVLPRVEPPSILVGQSPEVGEGSLPLGMVIGTLVHRIFEMPQILDQPGPDLRRLLEAMAANLLVSAPADAASGGESLAAPDPATLHRVVGTVEAVLQRLGSAQPGAEAVRRLLTAPGETEVAFALQLGRWQVSGRFDKLLAAEDGFEVVDWKTDQDEEVDRIVQRHRQQMQLYALALHRAGRAALNAGTVQVHLVLLQHMQVRTLVFTPTTLEAFAADLQRELDEIRA
jgi:ATP-dependent helicase/nuclease subunit A